MACCLAGERRVFVHVQLCSSLIRHGLRELSLRLSQLRLGLRKLSLGLCKLPLGLIECGLKWPRIDLEQQLPFPHEGTLGVIL